MRFCVCDARVAGRPCPGGKVASGDLALAKQSQGRRHGPSPVTVCGFPVPCSPGIGECTGGGDSTTNTNKWTHINLMRCLPTFLLVLLIHGSQRRYLIRVYTMSFQSQHGGASKHKFRTQHSITTKSSGSHRLTRIIQLITVW